jgi:heterodisulfide reductase subunit B
MKHTIVILFTVFLFSCCGSCTGVKESTEENLKTISDLRARIIMIHHNDSLVVVAYRDSLWKCREDSKIVK